MSKLFKINASVGTATLNDWANSAKYGKFFIDSIADPNGATSNAEVTSIPSPFARIDLTKTAFDYVSKNGLDGDTIYHKIVSDTLDVAQIFFNYDTLSDKIEIIPWDIKNDMNDLLDSRYENNRVLGQTLNMYLEQDAVTYNFNSIKRLYVLNYIGPENNGEYTIIGATSPATLFFATANDYSKISKYIHFGLDKPFDSEYCPLNKRDNDFIIYLFAFRSCISNFSRIFPEVDAYFDEVHRHLSDATKKQIRTLTSNSVDDYSALSFDTNCVEILGYNFHKKQTKSVISSDFEIKSSKVTDKKPLVLPVESGNIYDELRYVTDVWGANNKAPFYDNRPLEDRTLPNDGNKYPYLTISDFLEDKIIRLNVKGDEFHSNYYFDGNPSLQVESRFLIPIKPLFFKYFNVEDLTGTIYGKKMFEFAFNSTGITVILRIPVVGEKSIEYRRIYFNPGISGDKNKNTGETVDYSFALGLMPNVKFENLEQSIYRIAFISDFAEDYCKLSAYADDEEILISRLIRNIQEEQQIKLKRSEIYVIENKSFDYIRISSDVCSGLVVPKFYRPIQNNQFVFSVDLGTTNTNIEYSMNGSVPKALDITSTDIQIKFMAKYGQTDSYPMQCDLIPEFMSESANARFSIPSRTALSYSRQADWNSKITSMAEAGFSLTYEKLAVPFYNDIHTNLKWSNDQNNINMLKSYIESLFIIMRNKVVLNNGNLQNTKIVWFYPVSMSINRLNLYKQLWREAYSKYFGGPVSNIDSMTESVAPYEYYKAAHVQTSNTVTIDIGGETTDVVFASEGKIDYISSFRFAANSIFGDGYAVSQFALQNGLVVKYKDIIGHVLELANQMELKAIFNSIDEKNVSSDMASFLFSLKTNHALLTNGKFNVDNVDFMKLLQRDGDNKIIFLIFYVAIVYHIAHIMKAKNMELPRYIAFSGNGSKLLSVLSDDNKLLAKFTVKIFEAIYDKSYSSDGLTIIRSENPKEATCKGGIAGLARIQDYQNIDNYKAVFDGCNGNFITTETYDSILKRKDLDAEIRQSLRRFVDFLFDLQKSVDLEKWFGVSAKSISNAKDICNRDIVRYFRDGLNQKLEEVSKETVVEETLFFYPLHGIINSLAKVLNEEE